MAAVLQRRNKLRFTGMAMRWIASTLATMACLAVAAPVESRSPTPVRFGHLTACVDDVEFSAKFFADVFGWQRQEVHASTGKVPARLSEQPSSSVVWVDAKGFSLKLVGTSATDAKQCENGSYPSLTFTAQDWPKAVKAFRLPERGGTHPGSAADLTARGFRPSAELVLPKASTGHLDIRLSPAMGRETSQNSNSGKVPEPRVDRIAIIVRNAEEAARFFTEKLGLRRHPDTIELDGGANPESGGIHVVFVDANGIWLALVQPVGPGPLNAYLDTHGDGVIAELIIEVPSIAGFYDRMAAHNIILVNTRGAPVDPVTKAHVLEPFRDKIAYFPAKVTGGLTIELVERGDPSTSLLEHRDRGWTVIRNQRKPQRSGGKP